MTKQEMIAVLEAAGAASVSTKESALDGCRQLAVTYRKDGELQRLGLMLPKSFTDQDDKYGLLLKCMRDWGAIVP